MDVAAIAIGDELLDGRIRDRNIPAIGRFLDERGLQLTDACVVPDDERRIAGALERTTDRADLVVATGGLGPTDDDRTRAAAAAWMDRELTLDESSLERLKRRFDERGYTFTPNNRDQCYFPEGAEILDSQVGTAAGFAVEKRDTEVLFFPGVPREFDWFLDHHLAPRIAERAVPPSASAQLGFLGLGESGVETRIEAATDLAADRNVSVRYLAEAPLVTVRLRGDNDSDVAAVREAVLDEIGDWLVVEGGDTLGARAGALLEAAGERVATAESCTAGWLSKMLTDVSGSSSWFEYGFVTYADQAKRRLLGVRRETLTDHGAVSPQTVREMAAGARGYAAADYALAISGIAGPTGGTDEKPVGTVDVGIATPEGLYSRRLQFPPKGRESVRRRSVQTALGLLIWRLTGRLERHAVEGPFPYHER